MGERFLGRPRPRRSAGLAEADTGTETGGAATETDVGAVETNWVEIRVGEYRAVGGHLWRSPRPWHRVSLVGIVRATVWVVPAETATETGKRVAFAEGSSLMAAGFAFVVDCFA